MVLKKSKHGVNSGNTFHFGKQAQLNQVRYGKDQNVVIKSFPTRGRSTTFEDADKINKKIVDESSTFINDGGLEYQTTERARAFHYNIWMNFHNNITSMKYSLNKRKRWRIPEQIKDCIENKQMEDTVNDFKVTLVERKTMKTCENFESRFEIQNDCVSYYDTKWQEGKVKPKKKYSFETDLKYKGKQKEKKETKGDQKKSRTRRTQHSRGVQRRSQIGRTSVEWDEEEEERWRRRNDPVPEEVDDTPEIHYEVCYQRPLTAHRFFRDRHKPDVDSWRYGSDARRRMWQNLLELHLSKEKKTKYSRAVIRSSMEGSSSIQRVHMLFVSA